MAQYEPKLYEDSPFARTQMMISKGIADKTIAKGSARGLRRSNAAAARASKGAKIKAGKPGPTRRSRGRGTKPKR